MAFLQKSLSLFFVDMLLVMTANAVKVSRGGPRGKRVTGDAMSERTA